MPNDISHYFISILSIDQSSMMLISSLRERLVSCDKASSFFEVSSLIRMEKILYPSSPLSSLFLITSFLSIISPHKYNIFYIYYNIDKMYFYMLYFLTYEITLFSHGIMIWAKGKILYKKRRIPKNRSSSFLLIKTFGLYRLSTEKPLQKDCRRQLRKPQKKPLSFAKTFLFHLLICILAHNVCFFNIHRIKNLRLVPLSRHIM